MKSKKIVLVSHCVLNQNAVIEGWARARGAFPIAKHLIESGAGIIQLPCPELIFKGIGRSPLEYVDYDTPAYREKCIELLGPLVAQIKEYLANGYTLLGVLGINNSPSCSISGQRGVLMEELFASCTQENIQLFYAEVPENYSEEKLDDNLQKNIENLLRG